MEQQHVTLDNGLRIVFEKSAGDVAYCGYVVCAGTRHEAMQDVGMAHFVEHMCFKGTARRRAFHINNYLERVGGSLNAFTNKQETVYHATVLKQDFRRAADILTDIVLRSTFPQHELEKEAEVVCDEIDSYQDSPSDLIFDEFEGLLFENHPLGRDILGTKERLRSYVSTDLQRHTRRFYTPQNVVFFVYGDLDFKIVVRTIARLTVDFPPLKNKKSHDETDSFRVQSLLPYRPQEKIVERGTHQAHVLIGNRACSGKDDSRFALAFLTNLLGGDTMNSRLNMALREKTALVYSVDAYSYVYPDTGVWQVYFGCDRRDVPRCRRIVARELERLAETRLTPTQLAAVKKQQLGQFGIARSNHEGNAQALGKLYAHYGELYDSQRWTERLQALTAEEIRDCAATFFDPTLLTTLIYW